MMLWSHHMRTTVDLDADVLDAARAIAAAEGRTLGYVLSRLARRGMSSTPRVENADLPTFSVPADAPPLTEEVVRRALDEG
jgi:hypothetical protein